jgi:hypothetical protein
MSDHWFPSLLWHTSESVRCRSDAAGEVRQLTGTGSCPTQITHRMASVGADRGGSASYGSVNMSQPYSPSHSSSSSSSGAAFFLISSKCFFLWSLSL